MMAVTNNSFSSTFAIKLIGIYGMLKMCKEFLPLG